MPTLMGLYSLRVNVVISKLRKWKTSSRCTLSENAAGTVDLVTRIFGG